MSDFSIYLKNQIANWIKGTAFATEPANVFVGLFNGDPTDAGSGGTEVTTTIRAAGRVAATFGTVTDGAMANSADVDFGNADGAATVSHFGLFDAASAGNLLMHSAIVGGSQSIGAGTGVNFVAGDLDIDVD